MDVASMVAAATGADVATTAVAGITVGAATQAIMVAALLAVVQ
jgi:hypothetical protein